MKSHNNLFISVEEAKKLIHSVVKNKQTTTIKIEAADGYVLAESLKSIHDSPPFDQSAMDGYAFRFADFQKEFPLKIIGEVKAGVQFNGKIKNGEAVRIFTGAQVPSGADTVVMQERTVVENGNLKISDNILKKGANIRIKGSQIRKGVTAILKATSLNPGSIGFLASLGIAEVNVFRKPRIAVIVTGDELVKPGNSLKPGQIFESNSHTLLSVLKRDNISDVNVYRVKDNLKSTIKAFQKAYSENDFVLFTGGISVGDYDFVGKVMNSEKIQTIFYKVKQKPGKPIYFGKKKSTFIFGLPGNPASVLTCYYEYVKPAIHKFQNYKFTEPVTLSLPLKTSLHKKPGLTNFLKAYTDFKTVQPLQGQESYIMKSFTEANCFVVLEEQTVEKKVGESVTVHLI